MFRALTLLLLLSISTSLTMSGQSLQKPVKKPGLMEARPMTRIYDQMLLPQQEAQVPLPDLPAANARNTELDVSIGTTIYDLQSNYSVGDRITQDAEGNIMAVWTLGFSSSDGYSDRGTGYNRYDAAAGAWGEVPDQRLEDSVRTGWPNHVITDSGTEFIVGHVFSNGEYRLHFLRREDGNGDWTEGDLPTNTPAGALWPRAASSGETVHVIGVTTSTALGAGPYLGVNLHILYYRSPDGGETWDIVDGVIPGLDSTAMVDLLSADSYAIDARGDDVAIGVFSQWNDVMVFKSVDGGDTWSGTRLLDFPVDNYEIDQGYTIADLPPYDTLAPDSMAIFTTDNGGAILIDRSGMVHAFYGQMYVQDSDTTDGNSTYYPGTDGIAYWNETFGADSIRTIANILDLNGNDTLDIATIDNIGTYFQSLTSMPSAGVDENNNIYLAYSMVMEGETYSTHEDDQHYRHIWIIATEDGGETWTEPYDAINEITTGDPDFPLFIEAVFPSLVRDLKDEVRFIYQQDYRPGLSTRGDMDDAEPNVIVFSRISGLLTGTEEIVAPGQFRFELHPNPVKDQATIGFELEDKAQVSLDLFNTSGQILKSQQLGSMLPGFYQHILNVEGIAEGMYFVRLRINHRSTVRKLVVGQ